MKRLGSLVLAATLAACSAPGPRPLAVGADVCGHCHMALASLRFAGELVSRTGLVTPFDDVGCLANAVAAADSGSIHSVWMTDYLEPDSMVAASRMLFLKTDSIRTPMNYGIVALLPGPRADSLAVALAASRLTWREVVAQAGEARP